MFMFILYIKYGCMVQGFSMLRVTLTMNGSLIFTECCLMPQQKGKPYLKMPAAVPLHTHSRFSSEGRTHGIMSLQDIITRKIHI